MSAGDFKPSKSDISRSKSGQTDNFFLRSFLRTNNSQNEGEHQTQVQRCEQNPGPNESTY